MAVICDFGTAPEQAKDGYKNVGLVYGTDEELLAEYSGLDVRFVRGAAVHGQPGVWEFAAMHPLKSMKESGAIWTGTLEGALRKFACS
jgi:hypothetical protein